GKPWPAPVYHRVAVYIRAPCRAVPCIHGNSARWDAAPTDTIVASFEALHRIGVPDMTQLSASRLLVCAASIAAACCLAGCGKDENRTGAASKPLDRASFNQRAAERFLPLFWREDANGNGTLDPGELAVLIGFDQDDRSVWIDASGQFTEAFKTAHDQIHRELPLPRDAAERTRRQLVLQELAQGRPTLVENDLTALSPGEKNFV